MQVSLDVHRYSPLDESPRADRFVLDLPPDATLLQALMRAREEDPTLAFRGTCRSGICGGCALNVDGEPRLACQVLVGEVARDARPVELAPLPHFRALRDLVVDIDPLLEILQSAQAWLLPRPDHDGRMDPEAARRAEAAAPCILCGICEAAIRWPGDDAPNTIGLVKAYRFATDPRDALGLARLETVGDLGLIPEDFVERLRALCPKQIRLDVQTFAGVLRVVGERRTSSHQDVSY